MIIDGKKIATDRLIELKAKVETLEIKPKLVAVLIGEDQASVMYVNLKKKRAEEIGMTSEILNLANDCTQAELLSQIAEMNNDSRVTGILVQLPFPRESPMLGKEQETLDLMEPGKDVDCLTSVNLGMLMTGRPRYYPATVRGVLIAIQAGLEIKGEGLKARLEEADGKEFLNGKRVVVIGRSNIVGKPLVVSLINLGATVTVCNRNTTNLGQVTGEAEILISATGEPHLIKADMVKEGAVVIDVGITQQPTASSQQQKPKVLGDVDFEEVSKVADAITPVPGGIGPLTICGLLENTFKAATNFS